MLNSRYEYTKATTLGERMLGYTRSMKTVHVRRSMMNCSGSKGDFRKFDASCSKVRDAQKANFA